MLNGTETGSAMDDCGERTDDDRPSLALHVCCGPCASAVMERLRERYRVHAVWYNPNVHPADEHERRLEAARRTATRLGVPFTVLEYDVEAWRDACAGLMHEPEGGARCDVCFRLRLERTAAWAAQAGMRAFATTLSISPHKRLEVINAVGAEVGAARGLDFVAEDFKQRGGFQESVRLSRDWGLYRQTWCGCDAGRTGT